MALSFHGKEPTNAFRLSGNDENSASFTLGWTLEQSPHYRALVAEAAFGEALCVKDVLIALQKHGGDSGYTDIELQDGHRFHAILEAQTLVGIAYCAAAQPLPAPLGRRRC